LTLELQIVKLNLEFAQYTARGGEDRSGAYLFMPLGEALPLHDGATRVIRVVRGPVVTEVQAVDDNNLIHTARVFHSAVRLSQPHDDSLLLIVGDRRRMALVSVWRMYLM
jgi:hypothetical protein